MATVTYEAPFGGGYDPAVVEVGKRFTKLLFDRNRLGEVTHPDFVELDSNGDVTLQGLPALQEYRAQFGEPVLYSVHMIAVPQQLAAPIPGTNKPYDMDHFFDLRFGLRVQDLPPGLVDLPSDTPPILTVVRMREPYLIREATERDTHVPGAEPGKLWVFGRTYSPVGEVTMLEPHGQHAFVLRQAKFFERHGTTMIQQGLVRPLEDIVREELQL